MEKLVSRPSGGGAKLGTLDMQSYLEVMGRQLAEIQAQHNQFYASRQERLGRARNHDQSQLKFCSSESNGALNHQGVNSRFDDQESTSGDYSRDEQGRQQDSSPSVSSGSVASGAAGRTSSAGQAGARRSLHFADGPSSSKGADTGSGGGRQSAGQIGGGATGSRAHGDIRAYNSTPPITGLGESVSVEQGGRTARARQQSRPQGGRPSSSHVPSRPPARPGLGTPDSVSTSAPHSMSPSSGSGRPSVSNTGTPSVSVSGAYTPGPAASPGAARTGTDSADSTPAGPYAVYEVSGVANISYSATPQSRDADEVSSASTSKAAVTPATSGASPSPVSYLVAQGAYTASPSAPSVESSALAVHGHYHGDTEVDSVGGDDGAPYTLAIAGRAFDGIDSEEDDDADDAEGPAGRPRSGQHVRSGAAKAAEGIVTPRSGLGAAAGQGPPRPGAGQQGQRTSGAGGSDSRPQSRATARAPLVVASMETEEALRALLASPRFATLGGIPVGASIDVDGVEVPDDVLAALARADGGDLDAALGAAMATSLRSQLANQHQQQQQQQAGGQAAPTAHGRQHHALGPGALTAAPAAMPKVMDGSSLRTTGNATARSALTPGAATAAVPGPRVVQQLHVHHGDELRDSCVEASIDLEHVESLSRTIEISSEELGAVPAILRGSAAYAAAAIAAQRAAAEQQGKPVLYSLMPRAPGGACAEGAAAAEEGGRRTTADGGRRRSIGETGSRRITGDGGAALPEDPVRGPAGQDVARQGRQSQAATHVSDSLAAAGSAAEAGASSASASPYRPPRASTDAGSVSASPAAARNGIDGDSVLFGSPNQVRSAGGDLAGASGGFASPYVPPSPPPGADPMPYMVSPTASHVGSRLKRNSRNTISDVGLGAGAEAEGAEVAQDPLAAAPAGAAQDTTLRPWSAASSKRQLAASGASSGPSSSINFDMSLTQAAAAVASAGGKPPSAVSSPTASARVMRVPTPGPVQVPQPQQNPPQQHHHQSQEGHPAYSTFSVAALSPSKAQLSSYDLSVDETGQPFSPQSSPKDPGAKTAAAAASRSGPAGPEVKSSKGLAGQAQHQGAPPLAAFSKAAALAAAADVGMSRPPGGTESRARHADRSAGVAVAATADVEGGADPHASVDTSEGRSRAGPMASAQQRMPSGGSRGGANMGAQVIGDSHAELHDSQSPGPPSVAARLSQLKARRQQQWQSQQGLHGDDPQGLQHPLTSQPNRQQADSGDQYAAERTAAAAEQDRAASTPGWQAGSLRGPAPSDSVAAPAALPAASSPLLPDAVAKAIARATNGGQDAASRGELNLGHGIAGLSVAIEAGAVKWAWQTEGKVKAPEPQPEACTRAAGSPCGATSRDSTLRSSSPTSARVSLSGSGADWALQHLPPPNWQRFGQMPAGGSGQETKERDRREADGAARHQGTAAQQRQPSVQLEGGQYAAARRHSEYAVREPYHEAKAGGEQAQHQYAHSAGGSGPHGPPGQQQASQFRSASASDAGAQGGKAMALLRLKQQSIMRHHLSASEQVRESEAYPAPSRLGQQQQEQRQQQPVALGGYQAEQAGGRAVSADARSAAAAVRPQRRASAPRMPQSIAEEPSQYGSRAWAEETDAQDRREEEPGAPQAQPKAYLKRRSAKVPARKVDWSYVKPRTNSRNPDYYGDQNSPDVILKTRMSPLTSPKGGVAKPALGLSMATRAKKPSTKAPLSPGEDERSAPIQAAARRRGVSNIPAAPLPAAAAGAGVIGDRQGHGRAAAGAGGPSRGGGLSPLDDLLAHVNTLLRDFDKVVS